MLDDNGRRGVTSASKYRILSFNCNSIGKNPKRGQVFHFLSKKRADILILVDTRISKDIENEVKTEWGSHAYFSSYNSQSRGVAILIKKNLPIKILDHFADTAGNISAILVEIEDRKILIEGIYNTDSPGFYSNEVFQLIQTWNPSYAIFVGDWNIVLDQGMDTKEYFQLNNPRARQELLTKMNELDLIDVFRDLNPTSKSYTWKQWGSQKSARLDYFLVSSSLIPFVQKAETLSSLYSDHSPIILDFDFFRFQRGRGFWKLNNSLLCDEEYVTIVKNTFKRITSQYAVINDDPNFIENCAPDELELFLSNQSPESLQTLPLKINPELFLDTLLLEIRRVSIAFSAMKKRNRMAEEVSLLKDIEILENLSRTDPIEDTINELNDKKEALEQLYNYQAQGAYIRSRAAYKVEGERLKDPQRCSATLRNTMGFKSLFLS